MGHSVKICETEVAGVDEMTAEGWEGRIFRMSREAYDRWQKRAERWTPGVYLLFSDHFDRAKHGNKLYIGHTDDIKRRIVEHIPKKIFWSSVVVVLCTEDWMNVAHTQNVEYSFIQWALIAGRYEVDNGNESAETHLGAEDRARLDLLLNAVKPIFRLAHIDVFDFNLDNVYLRYWGSRGEVQSKIQIETIGPKVALRILAQSKFSRRDVPALLQKIPATSIDLDATTGDGRFLEDVVVDIPSGTMRFCEMPLTSWKSTCGVSLWEALSKA